MATKLKFEIDSLPGDAPEGISILSESHSPEMPLLLMDPVTLFLNFALLFPITEEPHLFEPLAR